jgi:ribonuclease R
VVPANRRDRAEYHVDKTHTADAAGGELVVGEVLPARRYGPPRLRIVERLGPPETPGAISLIAIAEFDIPHEFPAAALSEAGAARPVSPEGRVDLRDLALVTIDGSDARDFDDAVWAEPDPDPANPGGWHLVVAIADVAWYVVPGSALDGEAALRGNSVYFADRVVPMLPEALSNGLCSLKPGEDRACLAAHLWIDGDGRKRRHRFERAVMRSAARLTYEQVQAACDGDGKLPLPRERLDALYGAFAVLDRARIARGALELDLVEYRVTLGPDNQPVAIAPRQRLASHRLIEEFMILANVAAAEELEARRRASLYRVHDAPDRERVEALRLALADLDIPGVGLAKGQVLRPELFNRVLTQIAGRPEAELINMLVLRAQAQAVYSPQNIGHFGLALQRYTHFTSPIRRYADLVVHRALLGEAPPADLAAIAAHVSATDRRAAAAERATLDRYRARLLGGRIGEVFAARVSGVARFGLFVVLAESGTDGLIPLSNLPQDFYRFDPARMRLAGRHSRRSFGFGDALSVRLAEADPLGGRLIFRLEGEADLPTRRISPRRGARTLRRRRDTR